MTLFLQAVQPNPAAVPIAIPQALPWQILAILLLGVISLAFYALRQVGNLKTYLGDPPFPTQVAVVVGGIYGFVIFITVVTCRLALGMIIPDGYDMPAYLIAAVLGVAGGWGVGKHVFSAERDKAKTEAALAMQGAVPTQPPPAQVTFNAGSEGNIQTAPQPAQPVKPAAPPIPAAGEKGE